MPLRRRIALVALFLLAAAGGASAQNYQVKDAFGATQTMGSAKAGGVNYPQNAAVDSGGVDATDPTHHAIKTIGAMAGYPYTSAGFQQVASFSSATGFTPPGGATLCLIQAEGNNVRFRTDGTNPTSTIGMLLPVGAVLKLTANLAGVKFIPTTGNATLDVDCYH